MRTLIIVENLKSYADATAIINELKTVDGAEQVFIEPMESIVEIIHHKQLDMEAIKSKLSYMGYPPATNNGDRIVL